VDERARAALVDLIRQTVSADLDELYVRLDRIERRIATSRSFAREELDRQRREAVRHARQRGLSISMIAAALGIGRTTVATIIERERIAEPDYVTGMDGKRHPARHGRASGRSGRAVHSSYPA
jgi:hypothetical protein